MGTEFSLATTDGSSASHTAHRALDIQRIPAQLASVSLLGPPCSVFGAVGFDLHTTGLWGVAEQMGQ